MTSTTLPFSNAKTVAAPGGSFGVTPARTGPSAASSFSGGSSAGQAGMVKAPKAEFNRELSRRTESQSRREITESRRTTQAEGRSRADEAKKDEKVSSGEASSRTERGARESRGAASESQGRAEGAGKSGRAERTKGSSGGNSEADTANDVREVQGSSEDGGGEAAVVGKVDGKDEAAVSAEDAESVADEKSVDGATDEAAGQVTLELQGQVLTATQENAAETFDFSAMLANGGQDVGAEQGAVAQQVGVTVTPGPQVQVATLEGVDAEADGAAGSEEPTAGVEIGEWAGNGSAEGAEGLTGAGDGAETNEPGRLAKETGVQQVGREAGAAQDEAGERERVNGGPSHGRHETVKGGGVGGMGQEAAALATASGVVPAGQAEVVDTSFSRSAASALDRLTAMHSLTSPQQSTPATTTTTTVAETAPAYTPSDRFLTANTPSIVTGVRSQLLQGGGTLTMRLDPPELGALQVAVVMKDGLASVSFSADNAEAAKLITSTLSQLRDTLSAAGLTVDRLSVQQTVKSDAPSNQGNNNSSADARSSGQPFQAQDENARRDQQRRDQFDRMWRKASGDDVNLFA